MDKIEKILLFGVLPCMLFFAYLPSMHAPFLFDDIIHIEKNKNIHITELSCTSLKKVSEGHRPIPMITFAINYYINGPNPFSFRIFNIFIHFLNTILIFYISKKIFFAANIKKKINLMAVSVAAIWSIHPIQIQSVTYIVQRMNIISFFFSLLAIFFYFQFKYTQSLTKKIFHIVLILLLIISSVYSKQNAIITPIIILMFEFIFYRKNKFILTTIMTVLILLILYFLYIKYIPVWYLKKNYTPLQRILTEFRVIIFYISLIIFPCPNRFNIDHDFIISNSLFEPINTFYSFLFILIFLLFSIFLIKKYPLFFFGLSSFFVAHSVESTIIPLDISFEHRNYAPSFYLIIFSVYLLNTIFSEKIFISIIIIVNMLLTQFSFERNKVWKNGISLWKDSVNKSSEKSRPLESFAYYLEESGRFEDSIHFYEKAIILNPKNEKNYHFLGRIYVKKGDMQKAFDLYQKGLEVKNNSKEIYNSIGELMFILKKYEESIFYFKKAINVDKKYVAPYINMANSLAMIGYTESSLENYNTALLYDQNNIDAMYNKSILFIKMNMLDEAEKLLKTILTLYPDFKDANYLIEIIKKTKNNKQGG